MNRPLLTAAAFLALTLCGCAGRFPLDAIAPQPESERLPLGIWRAASIEAARAIANGDSALARRLNIALARDIYAAQQRISPAAAVPADPVASRAGSAPIRDSVDPAMPTLERAAEALAELGGKK